MSRLSGMAAALVLGAILVVTPAAWAQLNVFGLHGPSTPPALARKLDQPVPATFMAALAKASHEGLDFTGKPAGTRLLIPVSGPHPGVADKVGLLYIGADFCPYCAADRWGLMLTVLRFGTLSDVRFMLSTAHDVYPNTPTVTFQHARYRSPHLDFQAVEVANRDEHPLTTPDKLQTKILTTFDAPPYTQFKGSIPFVYLDGKYTLGDLLVMPGPLGGKDWRQVARELADPHSALFKSVMPNVNLLTAAICRLDGGKPADVCTAPGVTAARGALAELHAKHR